MPRTILAKCESHGSRFSDIRRVRGLLVMLVLAAIPVGPLPGAQVTTIQGEDPAGPHIVLMVATSSHDSSIGVARQIATLPVRRGRLTIVEMQEPVANEKLEEFLAPALSPDNHIDWVWVDRGGVAEDSAGNKLTAPTVTLPVAKEERVRRTVGEVLGPDAAIEVLAAEDQPSIARRGMVSFAYPSNTPRSRQVRYTRQLAVALLRESGAVDDDADFTWARLEQYASRLVALYDAEGIGSGGPPRLERIIDQRMDDVGVYRVCGEDVREGALAAATVAIFPGGSGRGIGNGLQEEGRQLLRDYIFGGGGYLGICAGAYFAGSGLDNYLGAIRLRHSQPWTRGRATVKIELTEEGKAIFGDDKTSLDVRYANGPVFLAADQIDGGDSDFVVLARFKTPSTDRSGTVREEMIGEAAVGYKDYGQGRLLIISPHPESHEEHCDFVVRAIEWTCITVDRPPAPEPALGNRAAEG